MQLWCKKLMGEIYRGMKERIKFGEKIVVNKWTNENSIKKK